MARERARSLAIRLAHFLFVWSGLLFIHECGHALVARWQGYSIGSMTIGAGPVIWRGTAAETPVTFRLVPLAGITRVAPPALDSRASLAGRGLMFSAGILLTAAGAFVVAGVTTGWERMFGRRCTWGRMILADAIVLSVFNLLPVPPLDGGRALLDAYAALSGAPLMGSALFWTQVSGLALAVLPMTMWTKWTTRIDAVAMNWRAPSPPGRYR